MLLLWLCTATSITALLLALDQLCSITYKTKFCSLYLALSNLFICFQLDY